MNEGVIASNKSNFLFVLILILGLSFHLFLGKLILDNIKSFGIILGIVLLLVGLHLTLGRRLYHVGGVAQ